MTFWQRDHKGSDPNIEEVVVHLTYAAQLKIRQLSGRIKRSDIEEWASCRDACEVIHSLADLCHLLIGPFEFSSKRLRRERLMFGLAYAWKLSPPDRRSWMIEQFKELGFDYSVLDKHDLGRKSASG